MRKRLLLFARRALFVIILLVTALGSDIPASECGKFEQRVDLAVKKSIALTRLLFLSPIRQYDVPLSVTLSRLKPSDEMIYVKVVVDFEREEKLVKPVEINFHYLCGQLVFIGNSENFSGIPTRNPRQVEKESLSIISAEMNCGEYQFAGQRQEANGVVRYFRAVGKACVAPSVEIFGENGTIARAGVP